MEWNKQQSEAIDSRGCDLLVTAAAGSGKTAVMVERICQLILQKQAGIRDMAVVTFTRAAAAEMRQRMEARLTEQAQARENLRPYLYDQLSEFPAAAIGTLHSFCGSLVRRFYTVAQLDPSFSSGDDGYAAILREEALEEALDAFFERKPRHYADFARSWGGRNTDGLKPLVLSVYEMCQNQPEGINWLRENIRMLSMAEPELKRSLWWEEFMRQAEQSITRCSFLLEDLVRFCQERHIEGRVLARLKADGELMAAIRGFMNAGSYAQIRELLDTNRIFGTLQFDKGSVEEEDREAVKFKRQGWKDKLKDLLDNPLFGGWELLLGNTNRMRPHMELLCEIVEDFHQRYSTAKRVHNLLDFSDLEHFALQVLSDEQAAGQIRAIYPYVFVDEYQDISPVQSAILDRLRTEGGFFCVGDIKQSIYRFRSAAPEIFLQSVSDCDGDTRRNIALSFNYRSSGAVISAVNHVFSSLMSPELGDVLYDGREALQTPDTRTRPYPAVEVLLVDNRNEKQGELSEIEDLLQTQREAIVAGEKILEIMATSIWDGKTGVYRTPAYEDFAVLIRQNVEARSVYADTFRRMGIPAVSHSEVGFAQEMEVSLLLDVLRLCSNFRLDHELIHVMYSLLGGFSAGELLDVRMEYPNSSYAQAVKQYPEDHEDDLANKIAGFLKQVYRWRVFSLHASVEELIYRICGDTGFYDAVGALPQGYRRQLNIRTLGKLSASFGMGALQEFVDASEQLISGVNIKIPVESENAVNIMTVHASKGLEYPVVFLCNTNSSFSRRDSTAPLLMHRQMGLGPLFYDSSRRIKGDTLAHKAIALRNRREFLSEEMRLLYVALTRARERLIITGTAPDLAAQAQQWLMPAHPAVLSDCSSLLDWVGFGLLEVKDGEIRCSHPDAQVAITAARDIRLPHKVANDRQKNLEKLREAIACAQPDADIERRFHWAYPYETLLGLPAKVSVTSLLEKRDWRLPTPPPPENPMPKFMQGKSAFQAAELGSFVHTILQHVPLTLPAEELRDFALGLEKRGLLAEGAVDAIHLSWVQRFLDSNIAGRIRQSSRVLREMPFTIALPAGDLFPEEECEEPILVQGIIDCCFVEEGKWVLLDYKTNVIRRPSDVETLVDYYTPQLRVYAHVLQRLTDIPVGDCCLYLVSVGREEFLRL